MIDVQESFVARPDDWAVISAPDIAERVDRLVAAARANGQPVVWVLHSEPGSGGVFDPDLGKVDLIAPLAALPEEPVIYKTSHNAFTTTALSVHLTALGICELDICGIRTEQCVETTARVASDLGYRVRVIFDATATSPLRSWDGSVVYSAEEVQAHTASALRERFAEIVCLAEVLPR